MTSRLIDLGPVVLRTISVSEMDNNVYLLTHKDSGDQVLIDAADDAGAILSMIDDAGADVRDGAQPSLRLIFTTHRHWDHVRALAALKDATGAPTACGTNDAEGIDVPMTRTLDHGAVEEFAGFALEAVHLRGHTPGSTALVYRPEGHPVQIFTGDSLFPGGVGKTTSPEAFTSLIDDVESRLFAQFDDDAVVHPGHGKPTTLGAERGSLAEWRERGW